MDLKWRNLMKKQIVFLSVILLLSGIITPVFGVTSARYKALWRKQLAEHRASKVVDNSQDVNSESVQNDTARIPQFPSFWKTGAKPF